MFGTVSTRRFVAGLMIVRATDAADTGMRARTWARLGERTLTTRPQGPQAPQAPISPLVHAPDASTVGSVARLARFALLAGILLAMTACDASGHDATAGADESATPAPGLPSDPEAIGQAFVEALATGDLATAEAMEDPTMRSAAPAASLGVLWSQLQDQFGAYAGRLDTSVAAQDPYTNVTVTASFAKATVPLIVTVSADGMVAGFHLGQPGPAATPDGSAGTDGSEAPTERPASYVDPAAFTETEVTVGEAPWALPGTLSMPVGAGPFPAVVLLAGSGPNDRDETIGPNKPLRDLAWGLASNGIAVLRYDKRTKAHQAEMASLATVTVHEETMDDALIAVDLLRSTSGVDPDRVFVVGHSLGGYLAPRIAAKGSGRIAGIGVLEGNARPLQDVIADQLAYLASPEGGSDPQAQKLAEALPAQIALVESPDLSPSTPASQLPLGIPAAYWLDLRGYDPVAVAAGLSIPIFISQGGRDYQVRPSELALWRAGLAGRTDVTIREYPALNHLLLAGTGPARPAEYAVPGHVDAGLVSDLADWVRAAR